MSDEPLWQHDLYDIILAVILIILIGVAIACVPEPTPLIKTSIQGR